MTPRRTYNRIWIYAVILVIILIISLITFFIFYKEEPVVDVPVDKNGFQGPTQEEQEELLRRIRNQETVTNGGTVSEKEVADFQGQTATQDSALTEEELRVFLQQGQ